MAAECDPRHTLDHAAMNLVQKGAVLICILLMALDGFDVLAISFASPGIAAEWQINRAELGIVLGMELFGMALGSVVLGGVADRLGRRPTILICLLLMTAGMVAVSAVHSVNQLLAIRFVTGLGIGGMMASTNAMAAEYSNARHRHMAIILMAAGYPLGAIAGGSVATVLLEEFGWRSIFVFGGACTGAFLFIVWFWLPESVEYLVGKQPPNALRRINLTLKKMGHQAIARLPERRSGESGGSYQKLISPQFRALTLLLIIGYFAHILTFYYILKWIPKIVVDMGYEATAAGAVLVWANVGGATGAITLGLVATRVKLVGLLTAVLVMAFFMVTVFGRGNDSLGELSLIAAATGFFTNAGVVGFYALMADAFPAQVRASGTGLVIGIGRGGATLGPVLAGFLFNAGYNLQVVSLVMGAGAVVAALAVQGLGVVLKGGLRTVCA
jgi:benzoate transport